MIGHCCLYQHEHDEPLSKRSWFSFEDSDPHRLSEPKHSQDNPSPFLESKTKEESIETGNLGKTLYQEPDIR